MTIRWAEKLLVAKIESTYGTDSTPGGGDAVLATAIELSAMEGQDLERNLDKPYLGNDGTIAVDLHSKIKFRVELQGSGTAGTAPAWSALIRACAFAETVSAATSVTYNPITSSHESISLYLMIGNTRYVMKGARGNVAFILNASGIPYLEFEFTSLFTLPAEGTPPTPNYDGYQDPTEVSNATTPTFTIDGDDYVLRNFKLDAGNDVQGRFLIGDERVIIVDRAEMLDFQMVAVPLSTLNPYALAKAKTQVELVITHGTEAGKIATIEVPTMQIQRPSGLAEAQGIMEWPLRGKPRPDAGNDQFTLTLT